MSAANREALEWSIRTGMPAILFVNISRRGVGVVRTPGNPERVSGHSHANPFDFEGPNWSEVDCWLSAEAKANCYCNSKERGDDWFIFRLLLRVRYSNLLAVDTVCVCLSLNSNWTTFWFYKKAVDTHCSACSLDWLRVPNDMTRYCGSVSLTWGRGPTETPPRPHRDCRGPTEAPPRLPRSGSLRGVDSTRDVVRRQDSCDDPIASLTVLS